METINGYIGRLSQGRIGLFVGRGHRAYRCSKMDTLGDCRIDDRFGTCRIVSGTGAAMSRLGDK